MITKIIFENPAFLCGKYVYTGNLITGFSSSAFYELKLTFQHIII